MKKQLTYTDKNLFTSPMPDFYALKRACAVAASEKRDDGSVDLPGFSLQTEVDEEDEPIIIKSTGVWVLFLVECDPGRWK